MIYTPIGSAMMFIMFRFFGAKLELWEKSGCGSFGLNDIELMK